MNKKLTPQILAMYLGTFAEVELNKNFSIANERDLLFDGRWIINGEIIHLYGSGRTLTVKPILRPLSDMTEEEKIEVWALEYDCPFDPIENELEDITWNFDTQSWSVKAFLYLLSKSFDLFGLIESGEAIETNKEAK